MLTQLKASPVSRASICAPRPAPLLLRGSVAKRNISAQALAIDDTNVLFNIIGSLTAGAVVAAVTTVTTEGGWEKEVERLQTVEGATPIIGAVVADVVAHSVPGLNVIFNLLSEPAGAAAGVAYLMTLVLSSPAVDPTTLAPKGTIFNAEKAADSRAAIRVPFTKIVPTALAVVDSSNDGSSGAGWTVGPNGLPKLPVTSVAIVLGVGSLILEFLAHAPLLGLFLPRILQLAFWLAVVGIVLDKRETNV